jgi:uncharacterized repeat protein (TIGR01451 family)
MRHLRLLVIASFVLWLAPALAQVDPIAWRVEVYLVSSITLEDGSREDRFEATTQARPGQLVEYRMVVGNVSRVTQPAGVVQVLAPVPVGTRFVPFSASPSSELLLTEFSANKGEEFGEVTVFVMREDGQRGIADPTEYNLIRWTLLEELEPGAEVTLVYRVIVE